MFIDAKLAKEKTERFHFQKSSGQVIDEINKLIFDTSSKGKYSCKYLIDNTNIKSIQIFRKEISKHFQDLGFKIELYTSTDIESGNSEWKDLDISWED